MTGHQANAMDLMSSSSGGDPWNWAPIFDWEIQPDVWYVWADPSTGSTGRCLRQRSRQWKHAPETERAVVLRHRQRPRPRDQMGYLLRRMLPHWEITVGATGHDFVEAAPPGENKPLVVIQNRRVAFCDPVFGQPDMYRTRGELGPYRGQAWPTRLVIDVFKHIGGILNVDG